MTEELLISAGGALRPWLPVIAAALPLFAALLLALIARFRESRSVILWLALIPALVAASLAVSGYRSIEVYPGALLGLRLGLDDIGAAFLLFTSFLWAASGAYANHYIKGDGSRRRFFFFHLLAMSGNFGVILAQDIAGFYMFFALLTFSAYALVIHDGTGAALRAGRVYIAMAVLGEALLAIAFFLAADAAGGLTDLSIIPSVVASGTYRDLIIALLISGFGIKAGMVVLHVWLPLAHPVAPVPASALLSGAMIKAGLLGWIRFLPLGEAALPEWGWLLMGAGLSGAFFGAIAGSLQEDKKTVLAYSSVSQMGVMAAALGIALVAPDAWPGVLAAVLILAAHHAFAKGALFLSTGIPMPGRHRAPARALFLTGVLLPALALAGAPFTTGVMAKSALKESLSFLPADGGPAMEVMLLLSSIATSVIMARFVVVMLRTESPHAGGSLARPGLVLPWAALVALAPAVLFALYRESSAVLNPSVQSVAASVYPVMAGVLAYAIMAILARRTAFRISVPPGDLLVIMVLLLGAARRALTGIPSALSIGPGRAAARTAGLNEALTSTLERLEARFLDGLGWLLFLAIAAGLALIFY
ncbi:MAG: complex I subunit 5 family protein [Thermodesulfobacteriota bacterium]|nr:MAG: complex I subunit 5 family protein [Thermodesulfobacteriota bacterium]